MRLLASIFSLLLFYQVGFSQSNSHLHSSSIENVKMINNHWNGRSVIFLGDSITDKRRIGTKRVYWEYLSDMLSIEAFVFGQSGHKWKDLHTQILKLEEIHKDDFSTIIIFAGTNDFNSNLSLGELYIESAKDVNHNGNLVKRKYREPSFQEGTFYGDMNNVLSVLKSIFPTKQIIILTPLHRGYAEFGPNNIQPDERFANAEGLYINDYVEAIKLAAQYWSVPVIDLFGSSGLQPLVSSNSIFFADKNSDLLHPNELGHAFIAKYLAYQLLSLP